MKIVALVIGTTMIATSAFSADATILDGRTYCRTVQTGGIYGQPVREKLHCLRFADSVATDNANIFFGNQPESAPYRFSGNIVKFGSSEYIISGDLTTLTTIKGSAVEGTVFSLHE